MRRECSSTSRGLTPSQLALALGKDGNAYLGPRRSNLGGITAPVAFASVSNSVRGQSAANAPRLDQGTYFVFRNGDTAVSAYRVTATVSAHHSSGLETVKSERQRLAVDHND